MEFRTLKQVIAQAIDHIPIYEHFYLEKDIQLFSPSELQFFTEVHDLIGDAITKACLEHGLTPRGAYAFGEFVAEMFTGWSTRFNNESDVLRLHDEFGKGAFNDPKLCIRVYLMDNWSQYDQYIDEIKNGLKAAYMFSTMLP